MTDEKALNTWISSYEDAPVITDIDTTLEDIKSCLIVSHCTVVYGMTCFSMGHHCIIHVYHCVQLCSDVECLMEGDGLPAPPDDKLNYYHSVSMLFT